MSSGHEFILLGSFSSLLKHWSEKSDFDLNCGFGVPTMWIKLKSQAGLEFVDGVGYFLVQVLVCALNFKSCTL